MAACILLVLTAQPGAYTDQDWYVGQGVVFNGREGTVVSVAPPSSNANYPVVVMEDEDEENSPRHTYTYRGHYLIHQPNRLDIVRTLGPARAHRPWYRPWRGCN